MHNIKLKALNHILVFIPVEITLKQFNLQIWSVLYHLSTSRGGVGWLATSWPIADCLSGDRWISAFWNCDQQGLSYLLVIYRLAESWPLVERHPTGTCNSRPFSFILLLNSLPFIVGQALAHSEPTCSPKTIIPLHFHHNFSIHHRISISHQNNSSYKTRHRVPIQNRNLEFWTIINIKCM